MKLIEIQRHYFSIKGDRRKYFCTSADTDASLNVKVVHFVDADNLRGQEMILRGKDIDRIIPEGLGLGMAYTPASDANRLNTQTPDSMGYDIHDALRKLKDAVGGNVTDYVCERLQWSREEITQRLFAEQIDAVALAIYNHETRGQAMIIGDQTGIGKGRVASSMIRYALVHNLIPVYCTENAGLFSDNYRDLVDIGLKDLKPFIVNSQVSGQSDARIKVLNDDDEFVVVHKPETNQKVKTGIYNSKEMPKGYDYILTTYSQLKNAFKKTKDGEKKQGEDFGKYMWLRAIAKKAFFIFDESHNISGSKAIVPKWWKPEEVELGGSNLFYCFNELSRMADGVIFLSATFAKRPENLVVYAGRTCIKESGLDDVELINAINQGGEALQEVISSDIVREGQMIRRESIYGDEIKVNYITLDKTGESEFGVPDLEKQHRETCDYITGIINDINFFEKEYVRVALDDVKASHEEEGVDASKTSNRLGISHDPIFSKLFMIVNQMLFAIKADAVANHAIRRLNEGKKVVIGLSSTMESFFKDLDIDENNAEINCDFASVLEKAIESTLKYRLKDIEGGDTEFGYIDIADLSDEGQDFYFRLKEKISNASSGLSLSPIDYITEKIERAGFVVSEVTGRNKKVVFTNEQGTRGMVVKRKYVTRAVAYGMFQNNQSDVLIINAAGATGASAHATSKNTNLTDDQVKPRVMIIAQMELDVNKEVQKRGRINRTGQLKELPPSYDYLISAIPAEKRLMMMMQKKLKSLDANSTSNQKQSTGIIDTSDFMNKYGDIVCYDYLKENEEINEKLNNPIGQANDDEENDGKTPSVSILKVTGHVPVLTCEEQDHFYTSIQDRYDKLVHDLIEQGEYDLSVEAMDLDAKQIGDLRLLTGSSDGESRFADAVYVGNYECNILRKPYSESEIRVMMNNYMGGNYDRQSAIDKANEMAQGMIDYYRKLSQEYVDKINSELEAKIAEATERIIAKGGNASDIATMDAKMRNESREKVNRKVSVFRSLSQRSEMLKFFYCGRACTLYANNTRGICLGTDIGNKTKNPYANSNVTISFAVSNPQKILKLDIQDKDYRMLTAIKNFSYSASSSFDENTLTGWREITKESTAEREVREIIVGNILKAYKDKPEGAKLISFTTHDGEVLKGLLCPRFYSKSEGDKMVLSKYSLKQFLPVIKKKIKESDVSKFYLDRGTELVVNGSQWWHCTHLSFCIKDYSVKNMLEKHHLSKLEMFDKNGRETLAKRGDRYVVNVRDENVDEFIEFLDKMKFKVELLPSQVEQYFGEQKKLKKGNWKKVVVNKDNIPTRPANETATNKVSDIERKRKLLQLAKAKIAIAKAKAMAKGK